MVYLSGVSQMLGGAVTFAENAILLLSAALMATYLVTLWQARRTAIRSSR